jgi:alpha-L-rhamnosidase
MEVTGLIRFSTSGLPGTQIKITPLAGMSNFPHVSHFTLAGDPGEEVYESRFFYHGMRKVKIEGLTRPPALDDLSVPVISSIAEFPDSFRCSDDLVNWMNEAVKRTVMVYNTFLPNDPTREFKAWMQDPQNMFVSSAYLFNGQNMYERWQYDIIEGQRADGSSPNVTPGAFFDAYNSPWWGGCLVWLPWHWYQYYGDTTLLKESYPSMKRYVDYLGTIAVNGMQDWGLMDWQPVEETPRPIINTPGYYLFATIVAKTARLMDKPEDFRHYTQVAENIRNNFNNYFLERPSGIYGSAPDFLLNGYLEWKPRINVFKGKVAGHELWWSGSRVCTQAGQVMPLALGMVPEDIRPAAEQSLLREIRAHGNRVSSGFVSTAYLLQVLGELDPETGWEMTTAQDYPSWYSMTAGSDNDLMNEDWAGGNAFMPSLGGNISIWNYRVLAGIMPDSSAPGFRKMIIKPNVTGDLHWVEGWHESVYGRIISKWRKQGNTVQMEVTVPPNTTATVYVPVLNAGGPAAAQVLENGRPAGEASGLTYLRTDQNHVVFEAGSGHYRFSTGDVQ